MTEQVIVEVKKKYITVNSRETVKQMYEHILEYDVQAYDTETNSLNVRSGIIVGFSVSGRVGEGYYIPTEVWNPEKQVLETQYIDGKSAHTVAKMLIKELLKKKLVMHNAAFDITFTKNFYGIDLVDALWIDTMLLVHTVYEEGAFGFGNPFGLKSIAIMNQEELGLNVEEDANKEQIALKDSIKANGGECTKVNFELYKADLNILSEYGAADTDLTLRVCLLYLEKLKQEGLWDFFFEDEVMPVYKEVTIPMEQFGVDLDMELLRDTHTKILRDLDINKKIVMDSLLATSEAKAWVVKTSKDMFPPSSKGNWGCALVQRYSLPLEQSEKTGKYSLNKKSIEAIEPTNDNEAKAKQYLLTGDIKLLDEAEVARISMALWKEKNEGDYINIQSKDQLGEIVFKYMGIEPLTKTKKGKDQFDMSYLETLSKTYTWAENLRIYNKLLKIKSTYVDRFLDNNENGRYYFYYKQHGTVSGRYGSDAQQLPKPKELDEDAEIIVHYTNLVRAFLVSGKGRKIIDADYESLEPHCVDPEGIVHIKGIGPVRLDETHEGDLIATKEGYRKILKKWYSNKPGIRIRHKKGELIASQDHKFYVKEKGWTKVSDLKVGDCLEEIETPYVESQRINQLPIYAAKSKNLGVPLGFLNSSTDLGYLTGILLGDGSIADGKVGITGLVEDQVIDYFKDWVSSRGYNVTVVDESEKVRQYRVVSRELHSFIKNTLGIIKPDGNKLLRIPYWIYEAQVSIKVAFLAGLVDTDGTVSPRGNEVNISSKDPRFISDIIQLGNTIGLDIRMGKLSTCISKDGERVLEWSVARITKESIRKLYLSYRINKYIICKRKQIHNITDSRRILEVGAVINEILEDTTRRLVDITVEGNQEFIYDGIRTHNCFASVSKDDALQEIFNKGWDFYSTVAIKTEKLIGVSPDKKADNYLKKVNPIKRNQAKAYSLGIAYGMESFALSKTLDIPQKAADGLVEGYLDGFPGLKEWRENSRQFVKENGYIANKLGRIRHLPKVKLIYEKFGDQLMDWRFRKNLMDNHGKEAVMQIYRDYRNGLNNTLNFQLQSLAAAVVNRAAVQINRKAKELGIDAVVQAQVHDQLIINCDEKDVEMFAPYVQDIMENTTQLEGVTLKAPPEISDNWREGH